MCTHFFFKQTISDASKLTLRTTNQVPQKHKQNNQTKIRRPNKCVNKLFPKKINPQKTNPQLKVYVANLGKYNEGKIVGNWLNLPTTHKEIKAFLKNQIGLNSRYEEYAIHDYEADFSIDEYENIYNLNMLAVKLEQMNETEKNLTVAYCSVNGLKDTLSILNVCEQINDLSYVEIDNNTWGTKEEKIGYAILDEINPDLKTALDMLRR